MAKITSETAWLISVFERDYSRVAPPDVDKIKLSQMVSKLGFFYEKLRNAIDYNEDHLVRRNSVERLLKRQILFLQEKDPVKISQTVIYESIRAKYLPNETLPETIIDDLAVHIRKYLTLLGYVEKNHLPESAKLTRWILGLAACEINEEINPIAKEKAVVNLMYSHLVDNIALTKVSLDEKEKNLQIYLAVLRTLMKADASALRYALLLLYQPNWADISNEDISNFCLKINNARLTIEKHINHPLGFQLTRTVRPQAVFFSLLREMMEKNREQLSEIFASPETLEAKIREVTLANYQKIHGRLIGTIIRVIIYILLTKTVMAFILELPYDYFIVQSINWPALLINVIFHPSLMLLIALTIRVPGEKNTQIITAEIKKICYGEQRKLIFKPKGLMKRGSASFFIFNTVYLVMFIISFSIVMSALRWLHFNVVSGLLFVFFLCIVSFFGFRLRNFAKQLSVVQRRDNLFNFLVDFLSLPIIRVGRFFSTNFSRINIFLYILDFIIETPFKMLVEFLERAVSFINEKREEIVE